MRRSTKMVCWLFLLLISPCYANRVADDGYGSGGQGLQSLLTFIVAVSVMLFAYDRLHRLIANGNAGPKIWDSDEFVLLAFFKLCQISLLGGMLMFPLSALIAKGIGLLFVALGFSVFAIAFYDGQKADDQKITHADPVVDQPNLVRRDSYQQTSPSFQLKEQAKGIAPPEGVNDVYLSKSCTKEVSVHTKNFRVITYHLDETQFRVCSLLRDWNRRRSKEIKWPAHPLSAVMVVVQTILDDFQIMDIVKSAPYRVDDLKKLGTLDDKIIDTYGIEILDLVDTVYNSDMC